MFCMELYQAGLYWVAREKKNDNRKARGKEMGRKSGNERSGGLQLVKDARLGNPP